MERAGGERGARARGRPAPAPPPRLLSCPTDQPPARPAPPCRRRQAKLRIARAVFERQGDADLATEEYRRFEASAAEWLRPYAVFIWLRGVMGTGEHWRWGALAAPTPEVRAGRAGEGSGRVGPRLLLQHRPWQRRVECPALSATHPRRRSSGWRRRTRSGTAACSLRTGCRHAREGGCCLGPVRLSLGSQLACCHASPQPSDPAPSCSRCLFIAPPAAVPPAQPAGDGERLCSLQARGPERGPAHR